MSRVLDPRVERIFERALAGVQAQRERIVREACAGDEQLEREVLELLAAHADAGDFLAGPALGAGSEPLEVCGRFRIERHLGSGSMGTVYLAQQLAPVRRDVALKLLHAGPCSEEALKRFETERQTIARMNHAGIARLFDSGTSEDGCPWYAMEFVDGEPITGFCARRQLSLFARVQLVIAICRAAQHAHQRGVIHRDLKPGNVLVVDEDGTPVPKLIDFGVAKALTPLGGPEFQTLYGDLVGTLEYMSPEQALGAEGGIDVRTDVYAIGAILYELVTGQHPLPIHEARAQGLAGVLRVLRERDPLPPSRCLLQQAERESGRARRGELRDWARRVRGDLDWIVLTAVERDRTRRYACAADLAADLERFLAHLPVSVAPPGHTYRLARFAIRQRVALLASLAIVVSLVVGIVLAFVQANEAKRQRDLALYAAQQTRAALDELMQNAGIVVHKTDEQLADLSGGTRARLSFALWGLSCLERLRDRPETASSYDHFMGYAQQRVGEIHFSSGNLAEAQTWFERSLEHRRRDAAKLADVQSRRTLAVGLWKSGEVRLLAGEWLEAQTHCREALDELERLEAEGLLAANAVDVYLGMAQRRLADALSADGQDAAALAGYALARRRLELGAAVAPESWPSLREQVLALLGSAPLLHSQGRDNEASSALAEALTMLDLEHQRTGPANVWERSHRARALLLRSRLEGDRGGFDLALGDAQAALELAAALSSSDGDDMQSLLLRARAQGELGEILCGAGRADEAALVLGETLPALERIVRQEPRHAQAQCELALACQRMALALSGREPELAGTWQARGREIVDALDSAKRLAPRDRARLAEQR